MAKSSEKPYTDEKLIFENSLTYEDLFSVRLIRFFNNPICILFLLFLVLWPGGISIQYNIELQKITSSDSPNCPNMYGIEPGCPKGTGYYTIDHLSGKQELVCSDQFNN